MHFITNNKSSNHENQINKLIKSSKEIFIATAFLKNSGLKKILSSITSAIDNNAEATLIIGQHFALTEPQALYTLLGIQNKNKNIKCYLAKAVSQTNVFHPKLFLFKQSSCNTIIAGSSNITGGGLSNNLECSLLINCDETDDTWKSAIIFFQDLVANNSDELSILSIKQYELFFKEQELLRRKTKAIPKRNKSQLNFNYKSLNIYLKQFLKGKDGHYQIKSERYNEAKKVLNKIANDTNLTKHKFEGYLERLVGKEGQPGLWYSNGLHRGKTEIFPHYKKFQKLIIFIKENKNRSPQHVFTEAKRIISTIPGAGENKVTEIMMTYSPDRFANLNNNPVTVLTKEALIKMKSTVSSYSGTDYEMYCDIVKEISQNLGFRDMLEADSFFNEIYQKIKKKY